MCPPFTVNKQIRLNCITIFLNGLKLYFLHILNPVLTICAQKVFRSRQSLSIFQNDIMMPGFSDLCQVCQEEEAEGQPEEWAPSEVGSLSYFWN